MNWGRLKIVWLLWSGNRHRSANKYWGWVTVRTAVAASAGWGRGSVSGNPDNGQGSPGGDG